MAAGKPRENASVVAERILVAVSGGPDSIALLVTLHEAGRDVVAAHYDHALREGSDGVARQVAGLCAVRGIPLIRERRVQPLPRGSVQAAARSLRYDFLERARAQSGCDVVATAHTADDVVEGAVLHLIRGCGLAGLRGVPERRGRYVRPWLDVWRAEVEEILAAHGIEAYRDPANLDRRFARVRARLDLLPALERDRPGILRRIHAVARSAGSWHRTAAAQAGAALEAGPVTAATLALLEEPAAAEVLRRLYVRAGGPEPGLSRAHIAAMLEIAQGSRGGRGVDLPRGLRFRIVGGHLDVIAAKPAPATRLVVKECRGCDDGQAAHLRPGLGLRLAHRTPGMRMRPAGGRGTRKLQDIFVDARVPREERDGWPLVLAGDRLAWIPGVAVDADLASSPGRPGLHVSVSPFPVYLRPKVVRLETPHSPSGDRI